MKHIYIVVFIFFACLQTKGQTWVTIPDANFVTYLQSIIPGAMNGNQMNTSSSLVTTTTHTINVYNKNITDLTGVQYFFSLNYLDCSYNSLTSLPALPNSLTYLVCHYNLLTSLPTLPTSLLELVCRFNHLTTLPYLPNTIIDLDCGNNYLTILPTLPSSLGQLWCNNNFLTNLPALPSPLGVLVCKYNSISSLPTLPSLQTLWCQNNSLTSLPTLPNSLITLYCDSNNITCFPTFPKYISTLLIDPNPYNCLPNYIAAMQYDTVIYPLCAAGNTNGCAVVTGISQISSLNSNILIYPNPSNGSFQVTVNNEQPTEIKIYDVVGKSVFSQSINGNATINANTLNEGIYTINISGKQGTANKKLVIIK